MRLSPYYGNSSVRRFKDMNDWVDSFFKSTREDLVYDSFKIDVKKEEDKYLVIADLPGVDKEEVKVEFEDDQLTLALEVNKEQNEEEENYLHRERTRVSSQRRIRLNNINEEEITAKFDNGVLTVALPIIEEGSSKKNIAIE